MLVEVEETGPLRCACTLRYLACGAVAYVNSYVKQERQMVICFSLSTQNAADFW